MTRRNGVQPHRLVFRSRVARWLGHHGFTFAIWTFFAGDSCSAELRGHENRHVRHGLITGFVGFWAAYLLEYAMRLVVATCRLRPFTPLRGWWWRSVNTRAYRNISWERDAYRWAKKHWPEFDPVEAPS